MDLNSYEHTGHQTGSAVTESGRQSKMHCKHCIEPISAEWVMQC